MPPEQRSLFTTTQSGLVDAAFGTDPGRVPLPAATDPYESWHRSVALAGQGRYSAADIELRRYRARSPELASLHASTRASWLRQLGKHERARHFDGRAVSLVGIVGPARSRDTVEARTDALTGLAADALGSGRFGMADALLARSAEQRLGSFGGGLWRPALRAAWVAAELAMMRGDGPEALRHAESALALSTDADSLRHSIKTDLVLAAALSCAGETARARDSAVQVASAAAMHGLLPLRWAATMLCEGTGGIDTGMATSADLAVVLDRRGGSSVD
ncbi:hypothetical protein CH275_16195 [Rhodococcus sp. 06-235-1A]|uniref:hypothetical protein n=1 Tax=Rhodococcus sp. 06-235-1A TaxID=2022508 RepID=UPI000B9A615A|nr:hypothetical protein [Rhodococcus sp. 06-235-1A]OZD03926.1 hypothetical protein CH275_16195 [Rhodococcus sp. 06-235-1A]